MIRNRDSVYGFVVRARIKAMNIDEVVTSTRSPLQNPYGERAIGSIRRECLEHVIVLGERHLRRVLNSYLDHYHWSRSRLSLSKDSPVPPPIQPVETGTVAAWSLPNFGVDPLRANSMA